MAKGGWVAGMAGIAILFITVPVFVANLVRFITSFFAIGYAYKSTCADPFTDWVGITGIISAAIGFWYMLLAVIATCSRGRTEAWATNLLVFTSTLFTMGFWCLVWHGHSTSYQLSEMRFLGFNSWYHHIRR